ncbi:MAG: polyprenyl synthetase family protein [Chitinophagales bacterium]
MLTAKEIVVLIEERIRQLRLPSSPSALYEPAKYMLNAGGKRIRPALSLMASNLFTDQIENCIEPALAMEVFHNFSLVHDDIMDNAPMRRGMPSIHEKWSLPVAILSGDFLLIKAYELLCTINKEKLKDAIEIFNQTAIKVCEGQQMDMDFENRKDVLLEEYIVMITNKTSVLLGCSLFCGALAGGSTEHDAQILYDAGISLGICFQIQDDLLDVYADQAKFGKTTGGDIIQNKKTYLMLRTLQLADEMDRDTLNSLFSEKNMDATKKIDEVIQLYNKYNVRSEAEKEINNYYRHAVMLINKVGVPEERKTEIYKLAENVFRRDF